MTINASVQIYYSGAWNDITSDVELPIGVRYGRSDEHSDAVPTSIDLTLDNSSGDYSPRDPNAALYGLVDRGTPLRVRVGSADAGLYVPGVTSSYASTDSSTGITITGDMELQVELDLDDWRSDNGHAICARWIAASNLSWLLYITSGGYPVLYWSTDGTYGGYGYAVCTAATTQDSGQMALKVTIDVDNGAAGADVKFYTAADIDSSWSQLGSTVTWGSTTSIFAGTSQCEFGTANGGQVAFAGDDLMEGRFFKLRLYDGIGGTLKLDVDYTGEETDTRAVVTSTGPDITLYNHAWIVDYSLRGVGQILSWTPHWDEAANRPTLKLEVGGILRRLGQGDDALRSALYRDFSQRDNIVAYWPCEEGAGAELFHSGLDSDVYMTWSPSTAVKPAQYSSLLSSDSIPTATGAVAQTVAPDYSGANDQRLIGVFHIPDNGVGSNNSALLQTWLQSSAHSLFIHIPVTSQGDLYFESWLIDGTVVTNSGAQSASLNGKTFMLSLLLSQNGADIDWEVDWFLPGDDFGYGFSGTLSGRTYDQMRFIGAGNFTSGAAEVAFGHVAIMNDDVSSIWSTVYDTLDAWNGERAANRMIRLCAAESIALRIVGDPDATEQVGEQLPTELLTVLSECADADMGHYGERRDALALMYRCRSTLYNQTAKLTLDMSSGHISNTFEPPLDDQNLRNDVIVKRSRGAQSRAQWDSGNVGISSFVGVHSESVTRNLYSDAQPPHHATWRLHMGVSDQHRIASLTIELEQHTSLQAGILSLQQGDLIEITNPPSSLSPDTIYLMVLGWQESIDTHTWRIVLNCAPGEPWLVGHLAKGSSLDGPTDRVRADTLDGASTLTAAVTTNGTSFTVATSAGPIWTTNGTNMPFDARINGEIVRVTAISGNSSPQTFTVTRSINSVVRTHATNDSISLAYPMIMPL